MIMNIILLLFGNVVLLNIIVETVIPFFKVV